MGEELGSDFASGETQKNNTQIQLTTLHQNNSNFLSIAGEQRQKALEERPGNAVAEVPIALADGRCHEGSDVELRLAMMAKLGRLLPARCQDPAHVRLQLDATLFRVEERK